MIVIYTEGNNTSCNKTLQWFREHKIVFEERRINCWHSMTVNELKRLLKLTQNGFEDIISHRSAKYRELNINLQECTVNEALDLLVKHPVLLKMPIIVDEKQLLVGFNAQRIRCFLPEERRVQQLRQYYLSGDNDVYGIIEGKVDP